MPNLLLEKGPPLRRTILLGLVVLVPLFFLRTQLDPFNVPKLALLVFGVALVACVRVGEILQGAEARGLLRLWVPAVATLGPLFVAWLFSPYRAWALFGQYGRFQGILPYLVVVLFGILIADAFEHHLRLLAWAFTAAAATMGGYGLIQILGADPFDWNIGGGTAAEVALSTLGNPNFVGGFLGVAFPVSIAVWMTESVRRGTALACILLIAGGCIVSGSQGGWAAALAGSAILLGIYLAGRWNWARLVGFTAAALVALAVLGSVLFTLVRNESGPFPETALWRARWWVAASRMAAESPVVGTGPNTFAVEGIQHRTADDAIELRFNFSDDPHSVPLSFLSGAGLLGFLGFLVLSGWTLLQVVRVEPAAVLAAGFGAGGIGYLVQSLVSIDEISLRVALWICLGGLAAAVAVVRHGPASSSTKSRRKRKRTPRREPLRRVPALAALGVVVLVVGYLAIRFVVADATALAADRSFSADLPDQGIDEYQRAIGFREEHTYQRAFGFNLGETVAELLNADQSPEPYLSLMHRQFSFTSDFPDVGAIHQYAKLLMDLGQGIEELRMRAVEEYMRAAQFDALNPIISQEAASLLIQVGRPEDDIALLEPLRGVTGDPLSEFWGTLALAYAQTDQDEEAQAMIDRALEMNPEEGHALSARAELERD